MEYRIIKSPTQGTLDILTRRKGSGAGRELGPVDAVGLIQGRMIEMVCAADVAEKAVGVTVEDIRGNCPQNMILLAIFGDTASVEAVVVDTISAGIGDRVIITMGSSARRMLGDDGIPVDAVVVGIIDEDCAFDSQ